MSATTGPALTAANLNPKPERWGAFRAGNTDSRTRDATADLAEVNDTITAASCVVQRVDGTPVGTQDLTWTGGVTLDSSLRIITVVLACGTAPPGLAMNNPVDYIVTITVQTTGGRTLSWDAYQLVVAQIG